MGFCVGGHDLERGFNSTARGIVHLVDLEEGVGGEEVEEGLMVC